MPIPTNPPLVPLGKCPQCGGQLVERINRMEGNKFIGCIKYPKCTYVERDEDEEIASAMHKDLNDIYFVWHDDFDHTFGLRFGDDD